MCKDVKIGGVIRESIGYMGTHSCLSYSDSFMKEDASCLLP